MKRILYKLFSLLMSICLIFTVFISQDIPVHAEMKSYTWDELKQNVEYFLAWAYSQMGVVFQDHDFTKFLQNEDAWNSYFNEDHVKLTDDSISIDRDFVQWLKQAFIDYQDETYGYYIVKTRSMYDLTADDFYSSYEYRTACNLLNEYGIIGLSAYKWNAVKNVYDLSPYISHNAAFYMSGSDTYMLILDYDTWEDVTLHGYPLRYDSLSLELDKPYSNYEGLAEYWTGLYHSGRITTDPLAIGVSGLYSWYQFATGAFQDCYPNRPFPYIITQKGSNIMVFKSKTALMNYSVNKRSVFVTPDFTLDTGDLTASLDDLAKSIDDMNDTFQKMQDALGSMENPDRLTESELEDLLQQILDELKNGNNSGNSSGSGGSNNSGSSQDYSGFFGSILYYLELIVDYLNGILEGIEALVWFQWSDSGDESDSLLDIVDIWKLIKDNPETGSKEVADSLATSFSDVASGITKKFPFSIPWDLYNLFTVFSETDTPQAATINILSQPYKAGDGIQPIALDPEDMEQDIHDAPYFKLPIKVASFGIYEEIIVDMKDFTTLSTLSRTLFSLIFAVYLIRLTIKIISLFRGGDGD